MDSKPCTKCGLHPSTDYAWWCKVCLAAKAVGERAKRPPKDPEVVKGITKRCGTCKKVKLVTEFYFKSKISASRTSRCGSCINEYQKARQQRQRDSLGPRKLHRLPMGDIIAQTCTRCKSFKMRVEFQRSVDGKLRGQCAPCVKAMRDDWVKRNPLANRRANRRHQVKAHFKMDLEELEAMVVTFRSKQNGLCAICKRDLPPNEEYVDHCHKTGSLRGLLCTRCNSGLGFFSDNVDTLFSAIDYLQPKS